MKNNFRILSLLTGLLSFYLLSCEKNYTVFYEDDLADNLSVFSDRGYNIMSCYIDGKAFKTVDRISRAGFSGPFLQKELSIWMEDGGIDSDSLVIEWRANLSGTGFQTVSMILSVQKDFQPTDLNSLKGLRLTLNGANGYFTVNSDHHNKGTGSIYFHQALVSGSAGTDITGHLAGIFEATLPSHQITKGRFDHLLESSIFVY